ncbi:MAG: pitrilysin family protein [candidate division Zixibacteria bacterium]|nr:pitrilysin family protein [candidate division Zixibacteria bacterium]MDD5426477.1 pitrilysin family protein [candidate division Zixibacteria bacterium]
MKRIFITVLVGAAFLVLLNLPALSQDIEKIKFPPLNPLQIPQVEKVTLENGLNLYLLEDKSLPIFRVNARINAGTYLDPPAKVGLAEICGTVMRTGGTEKWTGDEIDEMLEGVGGSVETSIDLDMGSASVNVLSEYTDMGLEILAEILQRPVFNEDKIELAKVQERTGISRRNDDIGELARREFKKLIYGPESPYARHTEYATVKAIERADLVNFHKTYFCPDNVQMAIWGDFNKDEIITRIKQYFGTWPKGNVTVPPLPEVTYNWRNKVYYAEKADARQSYIRMGHLGGKVTDKDYTDRIVMNSILGEGFGSRLTNNVRTKLGLAYSTGGRLISEFGYPGYFFALASTNPGSTVKAVREMITQIKTMHTDLPTEEEMKKGKDGYLNSFVFNFDSKGEVLGRMMTYDYYGLPEDFLQKEKEGVEKVTPEAVMAAAKNNLRPDEMVILVVGNQAQFDEPLESLGLGPIEKIDITIPAPKEEKELVINDETLARGNELLMAAVKAHGGVDGFKKIKSTRIKGTYTIITPNGGFPLSFEEYKVFPDRMYLLLTVMGRKMYDITNGDKGWKSDQTGSLVEKTADDLSKDKQDLARNLIYIFRQCDKPDYRPVYEGVEEVEGEKIEYITLVKENGDKICRLGLNADSYQLYSSSYWGETPMGEGIINNIYADFKKIGNVTLPTNINVYLEKQKVVEQSFTEYVVNIDIPASTFEKPL